MTDNLSIAVHMSSLVTYWCHFPWMRCCFWGWWTCLLVLETYHLVWRCFLFDESRCTLCCLHSHGGLCNLLPIPDYADSAWAGVFFRSTMSSAYSHFLSLNLSTFEVRSLHRLWIGMGLTATWMHYLDAKKTAREEAITQECCEQYWTSPGCNTPQGTNYMVTCLPSRKLSKLDEPDMQDTAGEARTSS